VVLESIGVHNLGDMVGGRGTCLTKLDVLLLTVWWKKDWLVCMIWEIGSVEEARAWCLTELDVLLLFIGRGKRFGWCVCSGKWIGGG
jgi:hypothetical protein